MLAAKKTGLVLAVFLVLAAALTTTALWRGRGPDSAGNLRTAGQLTPGEPDSQPPADQAGVEIRPDDDALEPQIECPAMTSEAYAEITADWIERQAGTDLAERGHVIGRLALSDDPDHQLAAVLMYRGDKRSPIEQVESIANILARHPDHNVALWNLVVMCDRALQHSSCSDASLTARAEQIDKENSEVWALLAKYRYRRGDSPGAIAAMQRAIGSASTRVYYAEQILLFERAYAAASDYGPSQRLLQAFGDLAALSMHHAQVFDTCKRLGKTSLQWRRMCFDYGRILESRAKTLMGEAFGLALQLNAAKLDGNEAQVDELERRTEALRGMTPHDDMGTIFDDRFNARYLNELTVNGERAALALLRDEIERRRARAERCR